MKIMKQLMWSSLLLLLLSYVSACGETVEQRHELDPKNPTVLTLWHYHNGTSKRVLDDLVDEFNDTVGAEKGIVVNAYSQGDANQLKNAVYDAAKKTMGASAMPNMFMAYPDSAYRINQIWPLVSFRDYLTDEQMREYRSEFWAEGNLDGNFKVFPIAKSTEVVYLNKTDWDRFAADTQADLGTLSTWEGLAKTAKAYYAWSGGKAFFGMDSIKAYMLVGAAGLGDAICSADSGGKMHFSLGEEAAKRLWNYFYVPFISGYYTAGGPYRSDDVKTRELICYSGSSGGAVYFPTEVAVSSKTVYPIECMVLPYPYFEGRSKMMMQQGAGICVAAGDKRKEYASVVFLRWFSSRKPNLEFSSQTGYMPVKTDVLQNDFLAGLDSEKQAEMKNEASFLAKKATMEMLKTHSLYVGKGFDQSYAVEELLVEAMLEQAKQDRAKIEEFTRQGMPREDAVAQFATEANFVQWYTALEDKMAVILN